MVGDFRTIVHLKRFEFIVYSQVKYYSYPIEDSPNSQIHKLFYETGGIINSALSKGEGILVHCYAGVSRSSTIVLAYLIQYKKMSLFDAYDFVYKVFIAN